MEIPFVGRRLAWWLVRATVRRAKATRQAAALRHRRAIFEPLEQRTLLAAPPTLTTLGVSAASVASGQPVTFTAHVSVPSSASAAPSGGSVTFTDGATVLGTAPVVNGTASLVNSLFALGTHSVRATYSGYGAELAGSAVAAAASPSITVAPVGSDGPGGYAMPMYASASALGRDGDVVEQTESHLAIWLSVVSGGPNRTEGVAGPTLDDRINRRQHGPRRKARHVVRLAANRRIHVVKERPAVVARRLDSPRTYSAS